MAEKGQDQRSPDPQIPPPQRYAEFPTPQEASAMLATARAERRSRSQGREPNPRHHGQHGQLQATNQPSLRPASVHHGHGNGHGHGAAASDNAARSQMGAASLPLQQAVAAGGGFPPPPASAPTVIQHGQGHGHQHGQGHRHGHGHQQHLPPPVNVQLPQPVPAQMPIRPAPVIPDLQDLDRLFREQGHAFQNVPAVEVYPAPMNSSAEPPPSYRTGSTVVQNRIRREPSAPPASQNPSSQQAPREAQQAQQAQAYGGARPKTTSRGRGRGGKRNTSHHRHGQSVNRNHGAQRQQQAQREPQRQAPRRTQSHNPRPPRPVQGAPAPANDSMDSELRRQLLDVQHILVQQRKEIQDLQREAAKPSRGNDRNRQFQRARRLQREMNDVTQAIRNIRQEQEQSYYVPLGGSTFVTVPEYPGSRPSSWSTSSTSSSTDQVRHDRNHMNSTARNGNDRPRFDPPSSGNGSNGSRRGGHRNGGRGGRGNRRGGSTPPSSSHGSSYHDSDPDFEGSSYTQDSISLIVQAFDEKINSLKADLQADFKRALLKKTVNEHTRGLKKLRITPPVLGNQHQLKSKLLDNWKASVRQKYFKTKNDKNISMRYLLTLHSRYVTRGGLDRDSAFDLLLQVVTEGPVHRTLMTAQRTRQNFRSLYATLMNSYNDELESSEARRALRRFLQRPLSTDLMSALSYIIEMELCVNQDEKEEEIIPRAVGSAITQALEFMELHLREIAAEVRISYDLLRGEGEDLYLTDPDNEYSLDPEFLTIDHWNVFCGVAVSHFNETYPDHKETRERQRQERARQERARQLNNPRIGQANRQYVANELHTVPEEHPHEFEAEELQQQPETTTGTPESEDLDEASQEIAAMRPQQGQNNGPRVLQRNYQNDQARQAPRVPQPQGNQAAQQNGNPQGQTKPDAYGRCYLCGQRETDPKGHSPAFHKQCTNITADMRLCREQCPGCTGYHAYKREEGICPVAGRKIPPITPTFSY